MAKFLQGAFHRWGPRPALRGVLTVAAAPTIHRPLALQGRAHDMQEEGSRPEGRFQLSCCPCAIDLASCGDEDSLWFTSTCNMGFSGSRRLVVG